MKINREHFLKAYQNTEIYYDTDTDEIIDLLEQLGVEVMEPIPTVPGVYRGEDETVWNLSNGGHWSLIVFTTGEAVGRDNVSPTVKPEGSMPLTKI
jgi:hypothetical protein